MNVLVSAYGVGDGGAVSNICQLLTAYARTFPADQVTVVCQADSRLMKAIAARNLRVVQLPSGRTKAGVRLGLGVGGLGWLAKRFGADVLWCINFGSLVPLRTPIALGVHSPFNVYPWSIARHHPGGRMRIAALRMVFRAYMRQADGMFVQTPTMGSELRRTGYYGPIAVVPKAVEGGGPEEELSPELMKRLGDSHAFTFLYVSTLAAHKNHAAAVAAIRLLRKRGVRVRLAMTLSTKDIIDVLGAGDLLADGTVIDLGWISSRHLKALYKACDACVMPSKLESLSSAHLEAMQWGVPQVSSDAPFARDLCADAAIYANPDDPDHFAEKMLELAGDPSLRARLVERGYDRMKLLPRSWPEAAEKIRAFLVDLQEGSAHG